MCMSSGWPGAREDPEASPPSGAHPVAKGRGGKILALAILVVVLIVFVFQNADPVKVDFLVLTGHPRLIWLIVGCVLAGLAVGYLLGRPAGPKPKGKR